MKFNSILSLLCVTGVLAATLTGCGSSTSASGSSGSSASASNTISSSSSASTDSASTEIFGQVQSISTTSLTLLVGGPMHGGGGSAKPNGTAVPSGQAPSDHSTSDQSKPDNASSQPPQAAGSAAGSSDTGSSAASSSAQPDKSGSAPSKQTETIAISDTTAIKVEGTSGETDGTVSDITQGSFVDVTVDANNTATTIVVKNADSAGAPAAQGAAPSTGTSGTGSSSASGSN